MLSCELCIETTDESEKRYWTSFEERTFVAPYFLPAEKTTAVKNIEETLIEHDDLLYYRVEYPILHYGIIQSFIVRSFLNSNFKLAKEEDIWKYGVFLKLGNQKAIVEANSKEKYLEIKVNKAGLPLLEKLKELLSVLEDDKGIESVSRDGVNFISFTKLKNFPHKKGLIATIQDDCNFVDVKDYQYFINPPQLLKAKGIHLSELEEGEFMESRVLRNATRHQMEAQLVEKDRIDAIQEELKHLGITINLVEEHRKIEESVAKTSISEIHTKQRTDAELEEFIRKMFEKLVKKQKNKKRILFICSSPKEKNPLNFSDELNKIEKARQSAEERDSFDEIKIKTGVEFDNFERILKQPEHQPFILHISMHSSKTRGLYFEDKNGQVDSVTPDDFADAIQAYTSRYPIDMIVLSACNSYKHANKVLPYVKYVIETKDFLSDQASIFYAQKFYEFIFDGEDVEWAHENAIRKLKRKAQKEYDNGVEDDKKIYTSATQKLPTYQIIELLKNEDYEG